MLEEQLGDRSITQHQCYSVNKPKSRPKYEELDSTRTGRDPHLLLKRVTTLHSTAGTQLDTTPSNYKPIISLSITWELLSVIIATKLSRHMNTAQKSIENNTRGSKHQLLDDRTILEHSKTRQTNLRRHSGQLQVSEYSTDQSVSQIPREGKTGAKKPDQW